jgi:hypothetical protein
MKYAVETVSGGMIYTYIASFTMSASRVQKLLGAIPLGAHTHSKVIS